MAGIGCSSQSAKFKKGTLSFKIKICKIRGVQLFPQIVSFDQHSDLSCNAY